MSFSVSFATSIREELPEQRVAPPSRRGAYGRFSNKGGTPRELNSCFYQLASNKTGVTAPSLQVTDVPRTLRKAGRDTEQPSTRPQSSELCPKHPGVIAIYSVHHEQDAP